jgi:soluble cytochrome b562
MELLDTVMRWVVAPVAAFVWILHQKTQAHATDIAVIKAQQTSDKQAHDREFKQMREDMRNILNKLDDIEKALRK